MKTEGQQQSQKQEKKLAAQLDGQRSAGSGCFWSRKSDVRSAKWTVEAKWTGNKKSFSVTKLMLDTVERDAIKDSRTPLLVFNLGGRDYYVLHENDFIEIAERAGMLGD